MKQKAGWVTTGILFLVFLLVAGCGVTPKMEQHPYELQIQLYKQEQAARDERQKQLEQAAQGCESDLCRVMIVQEAQRLAGTAQQIPVYTPEISVWKQMALRWTDPSALLGIGSLVMNDKANARATRASIEESRLRNAALVSIVDSVGQNAGHNTHIEGGFIGGNVSGTNAGIGNTLRAGQGNIFGNRNTTDQSQGQINGDENYNSGRLRAPDYIGFNGGNCRGGSGGNGAASGPGGAGGPGGATTPGGNGAPSGTAGSGATGGAGGDCRGGTVVVPFQPPVTTPPSGG